MNNIWFQQDYATCHPSHATTNLLRKIFDGCIINGNYDISWLPAINGLLSIEHFTANIRNAEIRPYDTRKGVRKLVQRNEVLLG